MNIERTIGQILKGLYIYVLQNSERTYEKMAAIGAYIEAMTFMIESYSDIEDFDDIKSLFDEAQYKIYASQKNFKKMTLSR